MKNMKTISLWLMLITITSVSFEQHWYGSKWYFVGKREDGTKARGEVDFPIEVGDKLRERCAESSCAFKYLELQDSPEKPQLHYYGEGF